MKKIFTAAVMCATALSPIMTTSANAAVSNIGTPIADAADATTISMMENQCAAAAVLADLDGPGADTDQYSAEVVDGATTLVSGPNEVGAEGARTIDLSTRVGAGTFRPGVKFIAGNPYRNGGSVNMFGVQQATGGSFSNSTYDFTADFSATFAHGFSCAISVENYNPAVDIHHDAVGVYVVRPSEHGNDDASQRACDALNNGARDVKFGEDSQQCLFQGTQAFDEHIDAFFDPAVSAGTVDGVPVNQDQIDSLSAHESFGSGFQISETVTLGQVVVCISPSSTGTKLPGAWAMKNGYTGNRCSTAWYKGTTPYSLSDYAGTNIPNLNDGSHNFVTVPVI